MFAENLKALRQARDMTQSQLALKLGVDQRTVSAWEHRVCQPDYDMLARICDLFGESFDGMLT